MLQPQKVDALEFPKKNKPKEYPNSNDKAIAEDPKAIAVGEKKT